MGASREVCRVVVLGSTGSIGTQTLEVIEHLNALHARGACATRFEVAGLAARRKSEALIAQAERFRVRYVAHDEVGGEWLGGFETSSGSGASERWHCAGPDAPAKMIERLECDLVVSAMSGAAGLPATLRAVELGRDVALANKESLVAAGALVVDAAKRSGARLLPVDSEHSGVWQCLGNRHGGTEARRHGGDAPPMELGAEVARVILTASGGPFRTWGARETFDATPEEALKHPTWRMGPKVTVDSASLMNKALEVIEAHWLFGLGAERIGVLVHPQSVVHAIVEFADGSSVAQLGAPDMRTPIQYALERACGGGRWAGASRRIAWEEMGGLEFAPPDGERFPALGLARRAIAEGGLAGAVLNGANEGAVEAFLAGRVKFGRIPELVRGAMDAAKPGEARSLKDVVRAGEWARTHVRAAIG